MDIFFDFFSNQFYLFLSLISLGFFGSFSHCIGMCGPLVIGQISHNLKNIKIENYQHFIKIKNCALVPYHLGRITTYCFIAIISKLIIKPLDETIFFNYLSAFSLIIASIFFIKILFEDSVYGRNIFKKLNSLLSKFFQFFFLKKIFNKTGKLLKNFFQTILKKYQFLFANPKGINGFILGIILGFLPCGLIYGAVAIALNFSNPALSAIGMMGFGLSTFPALFLTGYFTDFILKIRMLKYFGKLIIFLNIAMLLSLAIKQILL